MAYPQPYDEKELLSLMANDDQQAFTDIYNEYWNKLYFLAHKHLKSAEAAEEIVQDVFVLLWNKRKQIQIQSLPVYLAAMTRYEVYRSIAKEKRYTRLLDTHDVAVDREPQMNDKQLLEIIEKLANHLPAKCRLVFIYNKLLDQPLNEVAEQLHMSPKTAEAHLTKALKTIRSGLGDAMIFLFIL